METLLSTFSGEAESQQNQDFFQDDNDVPKKKKKNLIRATQKWKREIYELMWHTEYINKKIF